MKARAVSVLRDAGWAPRLGQVLNNSPEPAEAWVEEHCRVLKRDAHSRAGLLLLDGTEHFLKLYLPKSPLQHWSFRWGLGRGVAAFDAAVRLQRAGIAVPAPEACLRADGGVILLTEAINGRDLKAHWKSARDPATGGELMGAAGAALGSLHLAGFSHGDCKWSNLLCAAEQIYLADLEAVKAAGLSSAAALRDLARFTLNAEDLAVAPELYQRFLVSYSRCTAQSEADIVRGTLPVLQALRARHAVRYGERGHHLLGVD